MSDESNVFGRELITGNDPQAAYLRALETLPVTAGLWICNVCHDEGCPSTDDGGSMADCTCEIVQLFAERMEPEVV